MQSKYGPSWSSPLPQIAEDQGPRAHMEDRFVSLPFANELFSLSTSTRISFFGVMDGHGGPQAAEYAARHLAPALLRSPHFATDMRAAMRDAFLKVDAAYEDAVHRGGDRDLSPGATAVAVLVRGDEVWVGWVGDSEAVVFRKKADPLRLVNIHKVGSASERSRIEAAGGFVSTVKGVARLNGLLAVSRAFGDITLKPYVVAEPDVMLYNFRGDEVRVGGKVRGKERKSRGKSVVFVLVNGKMCLFVLVKGQI